MQVATQILIDHGSKWCRFQNMVCFATNGDEKKWDRQRIERSSNSEQFVSFFFATVNSSTERATSWDANVFELARSAMRVAFKAF